MEYRYNPENYKKMMLNEDMQHFYTAMEKYKKDRSTFNFYDLERLRINLYLSLKHHIVEGNLNRAQVQEMQNYFGGLYDD